MRAPEAHRDTIPLHGADADVRAERARGREERQRERVRRDDRQSTRSVGS